MGGFLLCNTNLSLSSESSPNGTHQWNEHFCILWLCSNPPNSEYVFPDKWKGLTSGYLNLVQLHTGELRVTIPWRKSILSKDGAELRSGSWRGKHSFLGYLVSFLLHLRPLLILMVCGCHSFGFLGSLCFQINCLMLGWLMWGWLGGQNVPLDTI